MPDIIVDFGDDSRQKVIDYVTDKYGPEKVSQIVSFNHWQPYAALKEIGKISGMTSSQIGHVTKLLPKMLWTSLETSVKEVPALKALAKKGTARQKKLLRIACMLDGLVLDAEIHSCGLVISPINLSKIVPVFIAREMKSVTQYDACSLGNAGVIRFDFLGLKALTTIQRVLERVKDSHGINVDLENIPVDDPEVYKLLMIDATAGIFNLESPGLRHFISRLGPSVFEDLIALLALSQPVPLQFGLADEFVERKNGRKELTYPHPALESILSETYGLFIYQEQIMQAACLFAGFTMAQADILRKIMGKKITDKLEEMQQLFVKGAVRHGLQKNKALEIFALMLDSRESCSLKSHSAAYALITYQTAYLKAHYPAEFMSVLIGERE